MSPTHRLLPAPWSSLVLLFAWLVLDGSWSLGQMLLGTLLALAIPWWTAPLGSDRTVSGARPPEAADSPLGGQRAKRAWGLVPRAPFVALRLGATVLRDIVVSNFDVARRILGPEAAIRPGFVWVPLAITDPHGIVALAAIVTMTPGTLSADLSDDRRHLLVHALELGDAAALVESIKARYEAPLIVIFERR